MVASGSSNCFTSAATTILMSIRLPQSAADWFADFKGDFDFEKVADNYTDNHVHESSAGNSRHDDSPRCPHHHERKRLFNSHCCVLHSACSFRLFSVIFAAKSMLKRLLKQLSHRTKLPYPLRCTTRFSSLHSHYTRTFASANSVTSKSILNSICHIFLIRLLPSFLQNAGRDCVWRMSSQLALMAIRWLAWSRLWKLARWSSSTFVIYSTSGRVILWYALERDSRTAYANFERRNNPYVTLLHVPLGWSLSLLSRTCLSSMSTFWGLTRCVETKHRSITIHRTTHAQNHRTGWLSFRSLQPLL